MNKQQIEEAKIFYGKSFYVPNKNLRPMEGTKAKIINFLKKLWKASPYMLIVNSAEEIANLLKKKQEQ